MGTFYFTQAIKPTPTPIPTPKIVERIVYRPQSVSKPQSRWITPTKSVCESSGGKIGKYGCVGNWEDAKKICRASGGLLPTIEVLREVVTDCGGVIDDWKNNGNNTSYQSCYKKKGFASSVYWSSTTRISDTSDAWGVDFDDGYDGWGAKTNEGYVRCVRGQ